MRGGDELILYVTKHKGEREEKMSLGCPLAERQGEQVARLSWLEALESAPS